MAQEINCSCEITENEVTICYPPTSSGGGGSIGGSGTLNFIAKFTPDGSTIGDSRFFESSTESWFKNSLLNKTFDFENAIVNSKAGFKSIDANLHELFDGDEDIAITFSETERKLWKKNGNLVFNWQDEMLYPTGVGTHGVYERTSIRDSVFGYVIYDLSTNSTKDSTNNVSANFESRILNKSSGAGVFDWENETISSLGGNVTLAELAILGSGQAAGGGTRVLTTDNAGTVTWAASSSGGITSLNGLTGATQTFANDTNVTIVSAGTTHTLTWAGTLADARIASASTWNAKESALSFSTGLTRTVNSVANDLITGLAGGQTIISGTAATDKLIIKTTTGNQTTGASNLVSIKSGNNGANELIRIGDGIGANIGELSIWAAGQSSTSTHLLRAGTNFTYINAGTDLRLQVGAVNYINMLSGAGTVAIQKPLTFATGANVTLVAGSTTVAPLIFTSGTNKTTPTNGSMEYNGTNFFATRAGAVRENIVCASAVNTVSPTSPNRTITVNIDGTTFYIAAKTTND